MILGYDHIYDDAFIPSISLCSCKLPSTRPPLSPPPISDQQRPGFVISRTSIGQTAQNHKYMIT